MVAILIFIMIFALLFDYKWIFAIGLAFIVYTVMTTPAAPETWVTL